MAPLVTLAILQSLPTRLELPIGALCLLGTVLLEFSVVPAARNRKSRLQWFILAAALAFFVVGFMFNRFDISRRVCIQDEPPKGSSFWFQGHAFWHFLTAVSILLLYAIGRCERQAGQCHGQGRHQQHQSATTVGADVDLL